MRVALPATAEIVASAKRLAERLTRSIPLLPRKSFLGGGAACRFKGNRMSLAPVLGPEVVALMPKTAAAPAPPVFGRPDGKWTFVPFSVHDREVAVVILQDNTFVEYVPVLCDPESIANGLKWTLGFVGKYDTKGAIEEGKGYHVETLKRIDGKRKVDPNYTVSKLGPLSAGTTLWMPPGTAIHFSGNVLCFWWPAEDMRPIWEHLLSPEVHGIVVGKPAFQVQPLEAHGFGNLAAPPADDSHPIPLHDELFPLAATNQLPWLKPEPEPEPEPEPQVEGLTTAEIVKLLAGVRTKLREKSARVRAADPIICELEQHLAPILDQITATVGTPKDKPDLRWDTNGKTRALICKWEESAAASPIAANNKVQFTNYGKEGKCSDCGESDEIIYANGQSRSCFEENLLDRIQRIEGKNAATAKPLHALLKAERKLEAPQPSAGGGRSIPTPFRNQLQELVDAVIAAESLLGIVPDDENDDDEDDDDEEGENEEEVDRPKRKREDKDEDEEEEASLVDADSSSASSSSPEDDDDDDDDDEDVELDEHQLKRMRTAMEILDLKLDGFKLEADLAELEDMYAEGAERFYDAALAKVALIRKEDILFGLRRGEDYHWPWRFKTLIAAEGKAQELNAHVTHNPYVVYDIKMHQAQEEQGQ